MLSIGEFDAIIFTLFGAAAVSTALRIYTRRFVVRCMAVDDYLMVAAIVSLRCRFASSLLTHIVNYVYSFTDI